MRIGKVSRAAIKNKFGGKCAYCGCELGDKFHVDHVKAIWRSSCYAEGCHKPENHSEDNMFPACAPCNLFKGVFDVDGLRQEIELQVERARRYSVNFRVAERFGLIQEIKKPVLFWFEVFSPITTGD